MRFLVLDSISDALIVGKIVTMDLTVTLSTSTPTSYVPVFRLMLNDAEPFSSVVLLYVTPLIVILTSLPAIALPLAWETFTTNFSEPE